MNWRRYLALTLLLVVAVPTAGLALDPDYPTRPIKVVVPYAPGGAADLLPRLIGQRLTAAWGVPLIVDNRPGAGSIIGVAVGAKAPADGYTLTLVTNLFAVNASLHASLPYDTLQDFVPVMRIAAAPHVLVVNPSLKVSSVAELIAAAKTSPQPLTFASVGVGSIAHLEGEEFKRQAGIDLVHLPYKGVAPALTDVLGGHVAMTFAAVPDVAPYLQAGTLKGLAVTAAERTAHANELPTMTELGYKDFVFEAWFGLVAPRETSPAHIGKLTAEINRVLAEPEMLEKLATMGLERRGGPGDDFGAFIRSEIAKYRGIIANANIKAE